MNYLDNEFGLIKYTMILIVNWPSHHEVVQPATGLPQPPRSDLVTVGVTQPSVRLAQEARNDPGDYTVGPVC